MTKFDPKFFQKVEFTDKQIRQFLKNALRDLRIAKEDNHAEVTFSYGYNALIKSGIALLAKHGVKVRSRAGHHVKIIEKLAELLKNDTINVIGNAMRMRRNEDMYGGGIFVSEKENTEYLEFIETAVKDVERLLL